MKKGQLYSGKVETIVFPNKGVVKVVNDGEEEKAVVKDTLPGQEVSFVVSKKRKGKCEGRLKEVLCKSELEDVVPACRYFGQCGGCTYQTMSYKHQLELKKTLVKAILDGVIKTPYEFQGIIGSPNEWGYRNKMEFTFGDEYKDGPLALGMHKKGGFYDIVTTDECKIVNDDYNKITRAVLEWAKQSGLPFLHKLSHEGFLRHLLVRRAVKTGEITVNLVTTSQMEMDEKSFVDAILTLENNRELSGKIIGITHIINDSLADVVKSDETRILYGKDFFYEELLGMKFKISTFSFFQTNSLGAERLYEKAREFITESYYDGDEAEMRGATIYDLYSGTGTIAQMMAAVCGHVVGVEIVEEAVEAAKENAKLNGLDNCTFLAGDVLKVLDEIEDAPDFIILDPPRDGIHPKALEKIIAYGVENIVYISCKPTSLARDLEVMLARGYEVKKACAVDMFPNTTHVETVVLLSQRKADDYVEVELELDELDVTSAESKATYVEIKDYVFKTHGLKVSNLYISQVKRKCGIEVGENYNLPKSEDSRQPQRPEEKEKAIRDALEHFGMA